MPLVTTKSMFERAYKEHFSVGAFNVDNLETFQAVIEAAHETKSPVIIAITENVIKYFGITYLRHAIQAAIDEYDVEVALHLDHGRSVEICKYCIDNGFTSVMIDASAYDFEENIRQTIEVVEYAHAKGVVVESELGAIAGIEDDLDVNDKYGQFTHPSDVVEFVKRTNIDSLAIAIGTAHGAYKFKPGQKPQLRFDILEEIEEQLPGFPLVLHGSSSVPQDTQLHHSERKTHGAGNDRFSSSVGACQYVDQRVFLVEFHVIGDDLIVHLQRYAWIVKSHGSEGRLTVRGNHGTAERKSFGV